MNIPLLFSFLLFHLISAASYDSYITHPIAGDKVLAGHPYSVTWVVDPSLTGALNLAILGGGFDLIIGSDVPNSGSFNWSVETWWPSTTSIFMVLNTATWNTNSNQSTFQMESLGEQTDGQAGLYHSTNLFRTDFSRSENTVTVTVTQSMSSTVTVTATEYTESPTHTTQITSCTLSLGAIGGIVGGSLGGFLILGTILLWLCLRSRSKKDGSQIAPSMSQNQSNVEESCPGGRLNVTI